MQFLQAKADKNDQIIFSELRNKFHNWSMKWIELQDHIINLNEQNVIMKKFLFSMAK